MVVINLRSRGETPLVNGLILQDFGLLYQRLSKYTLTHIRKTNI